MHKLIKNAMILLTIAMLILVLTAGGCDGSNQKNTMLDDSDNNLRFVLVEKIGNADNYDAIYVDTKTGVQYFVHNEKDGNGHKRAWGSVLMGADGLPLLGDGYSR